MVTPQEIYHNQFILQTDRKSIFKQIQFLVKKGQRIALNELKQRRIKLQRMLEYEDKIYQSEFAIKVKSRIDEDIKKRKIVLLQIREECKRQHNEFVDQKKIQRELESCYEIREALKHNERMQVMETQLEQITEKERALKRKNESDEYWRKVSEINAKRFDQRLELEKRIKRDLQRSTCLGLKEQIETNKRRQEEEYALKQQEKKEIEKLMEDIKLEERQKQLFGMPAKTIAYRKELLDMIAEKKAQRDAEAYKDTEEGRAQVRKLAKEEEDERAALAQRKRAVYNATIEYMDYARRMHKLEEEAQTKRDARLDDLRLVDYCTKQNLKAEMQRRAKMASLYYAELRRQMCEQFERRLREAQEQREQKILVNYFVHPEKTRADFKQEQRKMREELDKQLAENERLRKEEEIEYNLQLEKLSIDRVFCMDLTEEYIKERKDFLPLHPNWRIYACPKKEYVGKCANESAAAGDSVAEREDPCIKPCGCDRGLLKSCVKHNYLTELKAATNAESKRMKIETC